MIYIYLYICLAILVLLVNMEKKEKMLRSGEVAEILGVDRHEDSSSTFGFIGYKCP